MAAKGRPLAGGETDLERAAEITPEDVEAAAAYWQRNAPPLLRDLLDSPVVEPDIFDDPDD